MTLRSKSALLVTLLALFVALPATGAQEKTPLDQVRALPLTAPVPVDPTSPPAPAERPALLHPREQAAGQSRGAAPGRQRGLGPRGRRPAGAGALRRAHGVQRHDALRRSRTSSTSCSRSACGSGPSVNAYTSFDETVYMLQVPTDKPEAMDKAFLILEDWAHNLSFDPAEIDKERGVIIEEWRLGRGARRAHARQAVARPAQGVALRRAAADRQEVEMHPDLQARTVEDVLRGLVPAGPDGGHRGRRLRQGGRRGG